MEKSQFAPETVLLASQSQKTTFRIGESLAATLYRPDTVIWLQGELGAGKTTFARGLGFGLGLGDAVRSPTYAIENRFGSALLHLDLFRLEPEEAHRIVEESEEFPGARIVEWGERAGQFSPPSIRVIFREVSATARTVEIAFNDARLPDHPTIGQWRSSVKLPAHVARHCDAVGAFAKQCAECLVQRGVITRPLALQRAGELHDLFRFLDFQTRIPPYLHDVPPSVIEERQTLWSDLSKRYPGSHEEACALFLEEQTYPALATIVRPHGIRAIDRPETLRTTEQKLLFYADKRVLFDRIVPLDGRFDDFVKRYGNGTESEEAKRWRKKTKELEQELFGKGGKGSVPEGTDPLGGVTTPR